MRIIAGKYKSRIFAMPKAIRPTQDKVRKALFDILGDIQGLSFLELFAGSGSVGFEAVSRGAKTVAFVENNGECLRQIGRAIESLRLGNCQVYPAEAESAIRKFHRDKKNFDIIFLDPPYHGAIAKKTLQTLRAYDILAPNGLIIIQCFKKDSLPQTEGDFILFRQSRYGDTLLTFYRHAAAS